MIKVSEGLPIDRITLTKKIISICHFRSADLPRIRPPKHVLASIKVNDEKKYEKKEKKFKFF